MLTRKQIGKALSYKGHKIVVRHLGPDLLCYVDNVELNAFYETTENARNAGKRYVDQVENENRS